MLCTTFRTAYCVTLGDVRLLVTCARGEIVIIIELISKLFARVLTYVHLFYCCIKSYIAGDICIGIMIVLKCLRPNSYRIS